MTSLEFFDDPELFLAATADYLAADPVLNTVVASVTTRMAGERADGVPDPDFPCWWLVVRGESGAIVGVGMRTMRDEPHAVYLLPMPAAAASMLAHALHERGEHVGGVNGALPATRIFAEELAGLQGGAARVNQHTRLFELAALVPPAAVAGRLRTAEPTDLSLASEWIQRFRADADEQAGREPGQDSHEALSNDDIRRRIEAGRLWFWEDAAGDRVHLTGANPPSFGVARIGPVYTPPLERRRGYAAAAVAQVSEIFLDQGARVCLFTDQANPTSNGIYQALGYRPVCDMANLLID